MAGAASWRRSWRSGWRNGGTRHEVHIVSYATPFRLQGFHPNLYMHEVDFTTYPLLKYPPYALALATRLVELAETFQIELIHAHYAMPHATSAYLAKQIMGSQGIKTVTTLHGTDITLVGADASFQKVIKFAIEESDGVTAVSQYLICARPMRPTEKSSSYMLRTSGR